MAGATSSLRERLKSGRLIGTFVKLPALESVEICAQSLDFCVVDYEHSQLAEGDVLRLVRHAAALQFPAVVRIPEVDRGLVNRLLEAGAAGLQLSSVRRVSEVRALRDEAWEADGVAPKTTPSLVSGSFHRSSWPLDETEGPCGPAQYVR